MSCVFGAALYQMVNIDGPREQTMSKAEVKPSDTTAEEQ